jgi:hypothetical protein
VRDLILRFTAEQVDVAPETLQCHANLLDEPTSGDRRPGSVASGQPRGRAGFEPPSDGR